MPNPPRDLKTHKGADDVDDMIFLLGDDEDSQAADDESSDSEGSVGPPTMRSDQESGENCAVDMPGTHRGRSGLMLGNGGGEWTRDNLSCST